METKCAFVLSAEMRCAGGGGTQVVGNILLNIIYCQDCEGHLKKAKWMNKSGTDSFKMERAGM